jgi:uncharacterized RDD family membrane protein YckC
MNTTTLNIAGAGKRIGGGLIDLFLTFVTILILGSLLGLNEAEPMDEGSVGFSVSVTGWPFFFLGLFVFGVLAVFEYLTGKTPGKMLLKTRVVMADGSPVGLVPALVRNGLRIIDAIGLYLVGLIVLAIDGQNRRIGDLAAGTRVINDPGS